MKLVPRPTDEATAVLFILKAIGKRLDQLGLSQKAFAYRWHAAALKLRGATVQKPESVISEVSRLLHGKTRGLCFFLKEDHSAITAAALDWSLPQLLQAVALSHALETTSSLGGEA